MSACRRNSISTYLVYFLIFAVFSCTDNDSYSTIEDPVNFFTEDEQLILNQTLHLPDTLFNYANPILPEHYIDVDAINSDNTPIDNQVTDFGATLGRVLFFDRNLSINNSIACASCHHQVKGFSDDAQFSIGFNGETTRRNSMTLINSRYYQNGRFFWDERAETLEEQVLMPIVDHIEMGLPLDQLEIKLQAFDYYNILFEKAFGSSEVTSDRIALALSQFVRAIISVDSKFDEGLEMVWPINDLTALPDLPNFTSQENLGLDIFFRGRNGASCFQCHGTPLNVNNAAKNNGLDVEYLDNGKGEITGNTSDNAKFKVSSLRSIARTRPYMHDGRFQTLMEVIDHYSEGVQAHPNLDEGLKLNGQPLNLNLSIEEKEALLAFLNTFTDNVTASAEKYSNPFN